MTNKEELFYQLSELIDEIDGIFLSSGYDIKDFDPEELDEFDDEILQLYKHFYHFKQDIER